MNAKFYCYTLLIAILLSHCTRELTELSIPDNNEPLISAFDLKYSLIKQANDKKVGSYFIKVKPYKTAGQLFFQMKSTLKIRWRPDSSTRVNYLFVKNEAIIDNKFKLRYFNGKMIKNKKVFLREGYYKKPYFYIIKNKRKSRINAPDGVFSHLVEKYILQHELKSRGDAVIYKFLNLISLQVETERIVFEKIEKLITKEQEIELKVYITTNYTHNYYDTYWVDEKNRIFKKTDFKGAILKKLIKDTESILK